MVINPYYFAYYSSIICKNCGEDIEDIQDEKLAMLQFTTGLENHECSMDTLKIDSGITVTYFNASLFG